MAISFDDLPVIGRRSNAQRSSGSSFSFDDLPSVSYASDDNGVRGKIARGMVSRIFSDENENKKILEAAKAQRVNPTRILDSISQKRAAQLPGDIDYKALDPLNILDEEQSLNRFLSVKDKKGLPKLSFKEEAEGIYQNYDDENIAAAITKLKSSYPDAGFDQKRPSQVLSDARKRLYPELTPFDFMRQMGAAPRQEGNNPFVEESKPLGFGAALGESLKSGATSLLSGAVQGYADLTGNQALSDEAKTVTRQGKIAQREAMEGRSKLGEISVSLANSVPIMAATYATGGIAGSGVGLGALYAGATAQKYGSNREEGYAPGKSLGNAALTGLAEAAPEAIPLGGFLKRVASPSIRSTIGRVAKQAFDEGISEGITTVGESLADSAILGKDIKEQELLSNVGNSVLVGGVMGAGFGGVAGFRDRIRQRVKTGDPAADEGAALAKEIFQQHADKVANELPQISQKPNTAAQGVAVGQNLSTNAPPIREQVTQDNNHNIDSFIIRQAQAVFDRTAGEELNNLRSTEGRDDVQLGQDRVNALAAQVADDWGVSVDQLLDNQPADKPFQAVAQNLGTSPENMLTSSQSSQDVVPQPAQEADTVGAGPSQIHGQGLITHRALGPSDGITLAQGANRTEAGQVVNHSNTPNTTVQMDTADAVNPTAVAVPNRSIGPGEELTINYETEIPKIRQAITDVPRGTISPSNSTTSIGNINAEAQELQPQNGIGNAELRAGNGIAQDVIPGVGDNGWAGNIANGSGQNQVVGVAAQQGTQVPFAASAAESTQAAVDPVDQLRLENKRLRDEADLFRREARTQEITGLPNRRQFESDSVGSVPRAVAAIDMDGLKALNDSVGHKAADAVLAKLGERLRSVETAGGKAYHLSGDEFAVSFQDPAAAQSVMAELQDALDNVEVVLDTPSGQYVYRGIGVSFGIGDNYATADESAKADKQRRLASGKREPARATDGGQVATPRRLVPITQGGNIGDLARRDIQGSGNSQVGQVSLQPGLVTPQPTQQPEPINRVRMTRDQLRSDIAKNLGKNVASKLERQPWFNIVDSVEDLPQAVLKSIDDAQNTQGFVTPDGNVYIVSGNIDGNATGVVLHEVGVHYGMRGVLGDDFAPVLARFKNLREANRKVKAAYDSVPKDTVTSNIDEEALAYYVEDNWGDKAPLMQRIANTFKVFANRLGIPLSKLNASPELLVNIAKGATKKAASGRVRFNGGDTMRSTAKPKGLPPTISIDGVERSTTNSNGQSIAETEEEIRNFYRWFGDSKVVDQQGRPMVVYHGTSAKFDTFDKSKSDGFWFTDNIDLIKSDGTGASGSGEIIEAYLKAENLLRSGPNYDVESIKQDGFDGIKNTYEDSESGIEYTDYAVLDPEQIKSATGNSGEFSSGNPDIRYSKRRTPQEARVEAESKRKYVSETLPTNAPAEWDWSDATKARGQGYRARITKLREQVQDRMLVFRDARDDIETQKDVLNEASDVYTLENLSSGKAGDRISILEKRDVIPLIKKMKELDVSPELLEDYLEAKHAGERNDGVAKINPNMPDYGSGISTKDAQDFLDGKNNGMRSGQSISNKNKANLEVLANRVYTVNANTRKALLDSGIIDKAKFDAMEASYKYYVPLRGKDGVESGFERIGTGVRRVKDPIKRALGRGKDNRAQNILGEVFADAQRAIILSEKAKVDQSLLRMALEYPNASVYEVEPVKVEQAFSETAGEVYSAVQNIGNEPGVVIVPYKGKRYRVLLKDERMANAYNKLNAEQLNSVFNFMGGLNRWFSAVLTRYNPSFVAVNMTRDFILGTSSIAAEHGVKTAAKVVKTYFPAMRAMWRDVRGKEADTELLKMAREYAEDGGKTSFAISERVEDIQKRIGTEFESGLNLISKGKPVAMVRKWIGDSSIVSAIEDANDAVENAMRFSAYSVLRQEGMSRQKAAQYAKDLTVNFNRRGQVTTILNSLYLFFNAGVQGGHRTLKLMKDNPGKMSVVLGGIASLQGVLAFMAMGIEDDETGKSLWDSVPEWEKLRNIVIPYFSVSNGKKTVRTVKIPMPYGFNLFSYAGGRAAKLAHDMSNGVDVDGSEFVGDMTAGVAGAFSPLPLESQGWSSILPYWVNIGLALRTNKDDLGRPITQEQAYAKYEKPRISYGKVDSPQLFKSLAKGLNKLGGGDEFTKPMAPALLDWSPEDLQYIAEKLTGGLGSTVVKSTSLAELLLGGIDVTAKEIPIVSSFFSSVDKASVNAATYYEAREKIERDLDRIRASANGRTGEQPNTEILDRDGLSVKKSKSGSVTVSGGLLLKSYRSTEKELGNIRDEMTAVYNDAGLSFIRKKLKIKQLQVKRSEVQQRFNRQLSVLGRK